MGYYSYLQGGNYIYLEGVNDKPSCIKCATKTPLKHLFPSRVTINLSRYAMYSHFRYELALIQLEVK
jgi:hypothetical protein